MSTAKTNGSSAYPQWGMAESYDRFGNRWSQTATAGTVPQPSLTFGTNGMNSSTTNRPNGYTYDSSGNMTAEPTTNQMIYDGENRMTAFSGNGGSASYAYDGNGLRVVKSGGGTTTVTIFSGSTAIAEYDNGVAASAPSREYVYNPAGGATTGLLAMISGSATTYYHQDALSVRLTTDSSGSILTQEGSFPFGESWYQVGTANKWFFTSYQRDSESGLDYALARYYNSRTGTFCSADPLAGDPSDPQSWNRYPYGRNDPIDITDPSGKDWLGTLGNLFKGMLMMADPVIGIPFVIGTDVMGAIGNGGVPPKVGFGGMALGSSWNGTPIMQSGGLTNGIQNALGLPTMDDVGGPINNLDAKKVYCNLVPSGRSESLGIAFGGIGSVSGSMDVVRNYNSGQTSLFATGGGGLGWNGGVSATVTTGLVYGLDKTNEGFSGPFKGGQFYTSVPVPLVSAGGSVAHGGGVTVASGGIGVSPGGRFSFGGTWTKTTKPRNLGKFAGFRLVDFLGYVARRPCN